MPTKRDYYDILGVGKKTSAPEIKKAYRKLSLKYHPDRNKSKESEAKFKEINEAYEVLSNPQKKQTYDQFGHEAFSQGAGPGGQGPFGGSRTYRQEPFTYTYRTSSGGSPFSAKGGPTSDWEGFSDPFEIFEAFFGGGSPFRRDPQKPRYSLAIDFMEAVKGSEKTIIHQGKEKKIKIPAGADDGTRIRFQDFDVSINVKAHPQFHREGNDIVIIKEIPFTLAILGGNIEVPTVSGNIKIKIRKGTQANTLIRLRGKGMPRLHGRGRGDQYIRLKIVFPERLNREQKRLLEEFQETS